MKHNACTNDDNSRYEPVTNRMHLLRHNGRRLENGVTVGQIITNVRQLAIKTPGREEFPVLDPVLGNLTDSSKQSVIQFNWGII